MNLKKLLEKLEFGIIEAVYSGQSGHPGGSLSSADIMTVLYFNEMNTNEKDPHMNIRDRFVLSKGHASPTLYSVLAEKGYFIAEIVIPPVLKQTNGFRRDLPVGGVLQVAPLTHLLPHVVDYGRAVQLLCAGEFFITLV